MTLPETTPVPANCPYCPHPAHQPGVECEGGVNHGPKRWHRCLCLNLVGMDRACPPQMDCQGGTLGWGDIWCLQRGQSLQGADGALITPDVLKTTPASDHRLALSVALGLGTGAPWDAIEERAAEVVAELAATVANLDVACEDGAAAEALPAGADPSALRERIADVLATADGWVWMKGFDRSKSPSFQLYLRLADAVLAALPAPADRAAVLREAADVIDAETRLAKEHQILEPDKFRPCRDASAQLRCLADEAQQAEPASPVVCGHALVPRSGTRPCVLPAGHDGSHQDQHTNRWPAADDAQQCTAESTLPEGTWRCDRPQGHVGSHAGPSVLGDRPRALWSEGFATYPESTVVDAQHPAPADRGTAAAINETAATSQAEEAWGEPDARPGTTDHTLLHRNRPEHHIEADKVVSPVEGLRCAHCGLEIEDRAEPSMHGSHEPLWVHIPGRYVWCRAGQLGSRRAEPATYTVETEGPQQADGAVDDLTAQENRDLADDLGLQLYRAQDALAFVAECCDIADREQRPVTTGVVREWLKGARCGRELLAEHEAQQPEAVSEVARLSAALERGRRLALTFEVSGNEFIAAQIRTALGADDAQDPVPADRGTAAAIDETAATIQAEGAQQPEQFTEAERGFLAYALHLADEQMVTGSGKFSDEDRAALVMFQRLAKAGCTCDSITEAWVEMPHAADCPMAEGAQS